MVAKVQAAVEQGPLPSTPTASERQGQAEVHNGTAYISPRAVHDHMPPVATSQKRGLALVKGRPPREQVQSQPRHRY